MSDELPGDQEVLDRLKQRNPEFLAGMNAEANWRSRHRKATGHAEMLDTAEIMAEQGDRWGTDADIAVALLFIFGDGNHVTPRLSKAERRYFRKILRAHWFRRRP